MNRDAPGKPGSHKPKTIAILAMEGAQLLDVSGPLDVFAEANVQAQREIYRLMVVALRPGPLRSSSGVHILPDITIDDQNMPRIDTLLIAGAPHIADISAPPLMLDWIRQTANRVRRYGSVCSGAFLLAHAGLLSGRRITTHWAVSDRLQAAFPDIEVDIDAIHMQDGRLRTAAGVTAGLDLALALVEEDLGHKIALQVSSQLVMLFKRPGGQKQFSRKGTTVPVGRSALQEVQRWVAANPAEKHTVKSLANRIGLSTRHFARLFREEVGMTPGEWIEDMRVETARALLETGNLAPKQVLAECGFIDIDTFRRVFVRRIGITPAEYRKRYGHLNAANM